MAVERVQQALMDLGYPIPSGATGNFLDETSAAVVAFKRQHKLSPDDPVIGVNTMAALDVDIVAFDVDIPPDPDPKPPRPVDWYARHPAGAGKVAPALTTTSDFKHRVGPGKWPHLDRETVADNIAIVVAFPDSVEQGGNGLCTTAAFVNLWAQDAADSYAAFATTLFEDGAADLAPRQGAGGVRITASEALRAANYSTIAEKMRQKDLPVPSQADWMVLSAIRDSSNHVFKFTGDPDDWVSHAWGDGAGEFSGEPGSWLRAASAWTSVVVSESPRLGEKVDHAIALEPARSRSILHIHAAMIRDDGDSRHSVVLRSPVERTGDGVRFTLWTWADLHHYNIPVERFEENYFGATTAFI
jgi:hypothetical protein